MTTRQLILKGLRKAWGDDYCRVLSSPKKRSQLGYDSGLILASRWPITSRHSIAFGNDSRVVERGLAADGYVAKGALHARIAWGEGGKDAKLLDCFVTHLESQDAEVRDQQFNILAKFIEAHNDDRLPVLLLGDLNTRGEADDMSSKSSQYHTLMKVLRKVRPDWTDVGALGDRETWGTSDSGRADGGKRIDFVLLANAAGPEGLRPTSAQTLRFADPKVEFLSDHCAAEGIFDW